MLDKLVLPAEEVRMVHPQGVCLKVYRLHGSMPGTYMVGVSSSVGCLLTVRLRLNQQTAKPTQCTLRFHTLHSCSQSAHPAG